MVISGGYKNNEIIKSIFDNHYRYLCRIARYYTGRDDCAQDIVQDVIISFWDKINMGLEIKTAPLAYLRGAVVKQSLKYLRDNKIIMCDIEHEFIMDKNCYDDNDDLKKETLLAELDQIVKTLSPQCRDVFEKIVMENKSYKDVALELDISVNSVKTQHSRAIKKIRNKNKLFFIFIVASGIILPKI